MALPMATKTRWTFAGLGTEKAYGGTSSHLKAMKGILADNYRKQSHLCGTAFFHNLRNSRQILPWSYGEEPDSSYVDFSLVRL